MIFGKLLGTRDRLRADHAAGRAGLDDVHRPRRRGLIRGQPAIRLHQQQPRRNSGRVEPDAQRAQIGRDDRHHIGVDRRRRGALVFLDLGQHLEGDAQGNVRRLALHGLLDHQFVRRIGERVDQADRDRLDVLGEQRVDDALGIGGIERAFDIALVVDALVHDLAQIALDQRQRLGPGQVVEPRHPQGADLQHVAEALGGDQADARALALEDRVRRDGGAVADFLDRGARQSGLGKQLGEAVDDGARIVVDARRHLLGMDRAVRAEDDDVGEGAADIDTDAECGGHACYSAAWLSAAGSCHCTFGTSRQPRAAAISARSVFVAASSTRQAAVSTITP